MCQGGYMDNELTVGDDVFQLELVDSYQVALFNNLKENSNFHITINIFVDVDAKKLNDILSFSRNIQVDKDYDNKEINVEDCDGDEDELIDEEEDNSDYLHNTNL